MSSAALRLFACLILLSLVALADIPGTRFMVDTLPPVKLGTTVTPRTRLRNTSRDTIAFRIYNPNPWTVALRDPATGKDVPVQFKAGTRTGFPIVDGSVGPGRDTFVTARPVLFTDKLVNTQDDQVVVKPGTYLMTMSMVFEVNGQKQTVTTANMSLTVQP